MSNRQNLNFYVLSFLFVMTAINMVSAMGSSIQNNIPYHHSKIKVQDGEFIRMTHYTSGEKSSVDYIVSRINTNTDRLEVYWQSQLDMKQKIPEHYTNYNMHITIDLQSGSVLYSSYINPETNNNSSLAKGLIRASISLDEEAGVIHSVDEYFDGYTTKIMRGSMSTRKGYPTFDANSTYYIVRFLDITVPGIAYLCVPQVFKNPIPVTFKSAGRETIETPAGEFNTIKYVLLMADPFLSKLMEPYLKQGMMWIEDSPRMLLIKATGPTGYTMVDEISTIQKKGMQ